MTTGILRPSVWIGADHIRQPEFRALLAHELTHVRRGDNAYLLLVRLLERLFWWNPLMGVLSERMRFYLELSCDQSCCSRFEKQAYREALAATMLKVARLTTPNRRLAAAWGTGERHNLTRIKMIDGSFQMRKGYISVLVVLVLVNAALLAAPGRLTWPTAPLAAGTLTGLAAEAPLAGDIPRVGQAGVEAPVFTKKVAPNYPEAAREMQLQGYVILEATLRASGVVEDVVVLRTLGKGRYQFEEEATAAIKQWEFLPATRNGEAVDVRMTLKIDFVLDGPKKTRQVAITRWRNLNPGLEGSVRLPRIVNHNTTENKKAADQTQVQIPVLVQVASGGEIVELSVDEQALAHFGNPGDIRGRVDLFLDELSFTPAIIGETPVDTEIRFFVPISL
nr:M56 family metallopeptidase [Acanthopleuribacter pedis]